MNKEKILFFSVIIPTLNEEFFLPRLLVSLKRQKFQDFEVIVVDGGSTDHTAEKAAQFARKFANISFFKTVIKNVSHQRNFGASRAKGKYLVFFDADVKIPSNFLYLLEKEIKLGNDFLTTYLRPDSSAVYDRIIMQAANLSTEIANLIGKPFVIGADTIIKKSLFEIIGGFDEKTKHAEDYTFSLKAKDKQIPLKILRNPKLVFSLRRYRVEGRINVLRKNAKAAIYVLTKGPITKDIFSYPMGGAHYVRLKNLNKPLSEKAVKYLNRQVQKMINKLFIN